MGRRPRTNTTEAKLVKSLDDLAAFEEFQVEIAPTLRAAIKKGETPEEIYKKVLSYIAARQVTIALTDQNPTTALAAAKEVMDRVRGKSTERKEIKHQLEELPDEQLDSLLLTKLKEASEDDELPN